MAPGIPTQTVYAERIKRAQQEMKRQGIDILLVGPSADLVYMIGYDAHLSERLNLLIIRQEGTPDLVVPVLESFLATSCEPNVTLRRWEETESPSELVASLIGETTGVTFGVSDQLWSTFLLKLQKEMPAGEWTTGQPILAHLRVTKDQSELDNLFEVARLTDEAWHEFVESGQISGLTESQTMDRLSSMMEKRGLVTLLDGIQEMGERASGIVQNMLNFSRKSESRKVRVDMAVIVDTVLRLAANDYDLKKQYDFRNVKIVREFEPGLPPVECDKTKIEQVLLNLVKNAAQALAGGKGENLPEIVVRVAKESHFVRIEVQDNGPGMEENIRRRVFEPFFTTKEPGRGTGLGLAMVYGSIKAHDLSLIHISEPTRPY